MGVRILLGGLGSKLLLTRGLGSPASSIPYDLAQAIAARCASLSSTTLAAISKAYGTQAGNNPTTPYLVYSINSASIELITSESQWHDCRVKFEVFADTQESANHRRDEVATAFAHFAPSFASGVASEFIRLDGNEGKQPGRGNRSQLIFRAVALFQTRVRFDT